MLNKFLFIFLVFSASLWMGPTSAQPIPDDPAVTIGKLPNGLTYYIRKNGEPKNRAVLYLALKAGSLMETDRQRGLAHFVEHMAFNGTRDFPKNELIHYLQKVGVSFGADLNAYTTFDHTVYQLPIPTDSAELLRTGITILANWAGALTLDSSEIESERGVIVEEERQRGKNVQSRMQQQLLPVLLKGSRHAERLPIGKMEVIRTFPQKELRRFYTDWYRPNLQAVIAVGDFDPAAVEQLIIQNFSALKNPSRSRPVVSNTLPQNKKPLFKVVTDAEYPHHLAMVLMRRKGVVTKTVAGVRDHLITTMINTMMANRLSELKLKGRAPFMEGQFFYGPYQGGLFPDVYATTIAAVAPSAEGLPAALKGVVTEVARMVQFGVTPSELAVTKKNLEAGNEKGYRERDKTVSEAYVREYLKHFLEGVPIPAAEYSYELVKKLITEITLEEVNAAAKKMLSQENMTIVVQGPEKSKAHLPTKAQLLDIVRHSGSGLTAYEEVAVNKPLLERKPLAGRVIKEDNVASLGVTKLTLSNGVKVLLKPTDFKNDQVLFYSFAPGGMSLAADHELAPVAYTSRIPSHGIGEWDNSQLRQLLAGTTATTTPYISELYQGFSGSASPIDLETALQLVYAYATQPRKDSVVFKKDIEDFRVAIGTKAVSPEAALSDTINAVFTGYASRYQPLTVEQLESVSLDQSYDFYKQVFADAGSQTFVFVGNFEADSIRPLLETYLGGLPASGDSGVFRNRWVWPPEGPVERVVHKGLEDKATIQLFFHGGYTYSLENNRELQALAKILEYKLVERLREREGGVYSPRVGVSMQKFPEPYYRLSVAFNCATANADKLIAAVWDEIEMLKTAGPSATDLEKFKAEYRRSLELGLRSNEFWLSYLASKWREGESPISILSEEAQLNNLKPEAIQSAAARYLGNEQYFKALLVPKKQ